MSYTYNFCFEIMQIVKLRGVLKKMIIRKKNNKLKIDRLSSL